MKSTIAWVVAAVLLAGTAWMVTSKKNAAMDAAASASPTTSSTVAMNSSGDKQVITIAVKDGYTPRQVTAKAGVPVVLKLTTKDTVDCSTTFTIPSMKVQATLPQTGETPIEIPAQQAGSTLHATCGMGMYNLDIKFI